MSKLSFVKYQGNGNDFIIIDNKSAFSFEYALKMAPLWCDRHFGIGADGVLWLEGDENRLNLSVINADGSLAANCGNGLRCVASYYFKQYGLDQLEINLAGKSYFCQKQLETISVDMGELSLKKLGPRSITFNSAVLLAEQFLVELANRHLVLFFTKALRESAADVIKQIPIAEYADLNIGLVFPDACSYRSLVYERGVGFTRSCGSGAVAAAAVIASLYQGQESMTICQPGGDILVSLKALASCVGEARFSAVQTGSACEVYSGQIKI